MVVKCNLPNVGIILWVRIYMSKMPNNAAGESWLSKRGMEKAIGNQHRNNLHFLGVTF